MLGSLWRVPWRARPALAEPSHRHWLAHDRKGPRGIVLTDHDRVDDTGVKERAFPDSDLMAYVDGPLPEIVPEVPSSERPRGRQVLPGFAAHIQLRLLGAHAPAVPIDAIELAEGERVAKHLAVTGLHRVPVAMSVGQ